MPPITTIMYMGEDWRGTMGNPLETAGDAFRNKVYDEPPEKSWGEIAPGARNTWVLHTRDVLDVLLRAVWGHEPCNGTGLLKPADCICPAFTDTGGFRIADLACKIHGVGGPQEGDGDWGCPGEHVEIVVGNTVLYADLAKCWWCCDSEGRTRATLAPRPTCEPDDQGPVRRRSNNYIWRNDHWHARCGWQPRVELLLEALTPPTET